MNVINLAEHALMNDPHHALEQLLDHPEFIKLNGWHKEQYEAGETIIREGDCDTRIFLILKGQAQVEARVTLEDEKVIRPGFFKIGEKEIFGELAMFDNQPRSASVTATKKSTIAVIDGEKLLTFFDRHPDIGYKVLFEIIPVLTDRLRNSNKKTFSLFAWGLKAHGIEQHL